MVGEYSRVARATVELPAIWRLLRGSIVADATVKTFHAHSGCNPRLNSRRRYAAGRDEQMDKVELRTCQFWNPIHPSFGTEIVPETSASPSGVPKKCRSPSSIFPERRLRHCQDAVVALKMTTPLQFISLLTKSSCTDSSSVRAEELCRVTGLHFSLSLSFVASHSSSRKKPTR